MDDPCEFFENCKDLEELKEAMIMATRRGIPFEPYELPSFGGITPLDDGMNAEGKKERLWSWGEKDVLVGNNRDDPRIVSREEWMPIGYEIKKLPLQEIGNDLLQELLNNIREMPLAMRPQFIGFGDCDRLEHYLVRYCDRGIQGYRTVGTMLWAPGPSKAWLKLCQEYEDRSGPWWVDASTAEWAVNEWCFPCSRPLCIIRADNPTVPWYSEP